MSDMFPWFDRSAPNCVDCPEHETLFSPDPDDWFCDDDITVSCRAAGGRKIAAGIRPQFEREYCTRPQWCPKKRSELCHRVVNVYGRHYENTRDPF